MKLYCRYIALLLKAQLQYRSSFWLLALGQLFMPFALLAGMYLLFQKFGSIRGWSFFEVALCFAVIHMAFANSECCARGFDGFSALVAGGDFDRILVRPRGTVLQVLASRFEFSRIGRLIQGGAVLIWAVSCLPIAWNVPKALTLTLMVVSGACIFTGLFILAATLCFWTIQGLEIVNIFTDGGREMGQYPLGIYQKWVIRFFTFVIPFGCVNYLPLLYLLGKAEGQRAWLFMLSPLAGVLFLLPCLGVWRIGVRHYRSTGS
ncbi:ABC-2 type transport system permease protein [Hydrogenispora ethanolica]|uniref:ABC-2 type transport system permease protein n=1 Tax=Hydrogenispora ethanolica TaxID=1082276 RepID=A0A4R1RC05_HYDET|nr:ABC-2 family transporter protein [Hydrogenispora ethanolica]TCL63354.1 ABC-2 type transport system permease protein [Hydrogenispora ethanolica]